MIQLHFDFKQMKIGESMGVLRLFALNYVKYANMEGFCRDSHICNGCILTCARSTCCTQLCASWGWHTWFHTIVHTAVKEAVSVVLVFTAVTSFSVGLTTWPLGWVIENPNFSEQLVPSISPQFQNSPFQSGLSEFRTKHGTCIVLSLSPWVSLEPQCLVLFH